MHNEITLRKGGHQDQGLTKAFEIISLKHFRYLIRIY